MKANSFLSETGFPLKIVRLSQTPLQAHCHEFHELVVITKGKGVHFTETEEYAVHAGDVFFIRPYDAHGYRDTEGLEIVNVLYYPDRLGIPLGLLKESPGYKALFELEPESRRKDAFKGRLSLSLEALAKVERLVAGIEEEMDSKRSAGQFLAVATLMRLLGFLSRTYEEKPSPSTLHLVRLGETLSFMETSYQRRISLDSLAKMACMSKSSLIRACRRITGKTPVEYLLSVRLAKAAELLARGEANIGEAAVRCGFSDGNYFARQFKKATGLPPREYKRRMKPSP